MGTVDLVVLVLTLIQAFAPQIKELIEKGVIEPEKAPESLLNIIEALLPGVGGLIIKNNPEWAKVVEMLKPLLEGLFVEKE